MHETDIQSSWCCGSSHLQHNELFSEEYVCLFKDYSLPCQENEGQLISNGKHLQEDETNIWVLFSDECLRKLENAYTVSVIIILEQRQQEEQLPLQLLQWAVRIPWTPQHGDGESHGHHWTCSSLQIRMKTALTPTNGNWLHLRDVNFLAMLYLPQHPELKTNH